MGNLQMNPQPSRSPYSRRPIFGHLSSGGHQALSRSLSPYISRTPYANVHRSMINKSNMKSSCISIRHPHNNLVYMNPSMIKSVIKNSAVNQISRSETTRMRKPKIYIQQAINSKSNRSIRQLKRSPISKQKYIQKPFQSSPNKGKIIQRQLIYQKIFKGNLEDKQNIQDQQKDQVQKLPNVDHFTISSAHKSPINSCKTVHKSRNSSGNKGIFEGHLINQQRQQCCCCFRQLCLNLQNEQETIISQNVPTQRKKNFKPFQQFSLLENRVPKKLDFQQQQTKLQRAFPQIAIQTPASTVKQKMINQTIIHQKNHQKCQQIIKRVRNFNEFLNQVKNKLRKQADSSSSQNNTMDNISFTQHQSFNHYSHNTSIQQSHTQNNVSNEANTSGSKSITLALRLENQKIELQKYKKLVQRQLSKQHSIESIDINSNKKDKLITINFQKKPIQPAKNIKYNEQTKQKTGQMKQSQQLETEEVPQLKILKQKDGKGVKQQKGAVQVRERTQIVKRVSNINKLFSKMQGMNKIQSQTHRQIREILNTKEEEHFIDQDV